MIWSRIDPLAHRSDRRPGLTPPFAEQSMHQQLNHGQYFGAMHQRVAIGDVLLTETRYAPKVVLPMHAHKTAYFCFVRRGYYHEKYGHRARDCQPMTVAFHPPEESHSERMANEEVQSFNIEVSNRWLDRVQAVAPRLSEPIDTVGGAPAWIGVRLYQELKAPDTVTPLAVEGLLLEAAASLSRCANPAPLLPSWLRKAREQLAEQFLQPPTLRELGRAAGVHPIYLTSAFRRWCGCSIGEFVRRRRVEQAAQLLMNKDLPLAEVAMKSGFSDQSHMTRLFRRATGLTPAKYREQC